MRLSVVVPVYRVEPYLRKCVDSLLNQDLTEDEYEIVLVDDGSPDGCGAICDSYASQYAQVKVVHRPNGGLSAARNSGIDVAQGDLVVFVDSDDYIEPNVLKSLVDKAEHDDLDVLRFNYRNVNEQYEVFEPNKVSKPFVDYRDEVCDGLAFLTERLGYGCYAWQFVIRRNLLEGCRFKEGIYLEDTEWTPRLLTSASRVSSMDMVVYNYLHRNGSITNNNDARKQNKLLEDLFLIIDSMHGQMAEVKDRRWFEGIIAQTALYVLSFAGEHDFINRKDYIKRLKALDVFPLCSFHATKSVRAKLAIANLSPNLFCLLLKVKTRYRK